MAPILGTLTTTWPDESACADFAARLAARPAIRDAFLDLQGELGAGKTTFVRHLLRALGVTGRVRSPTYAVLETYQVGDLALAHFDFYRFTDPREWEDAGFREVFGQPGLKLTEWSDRVAGMLPVPDLQLSLALGPDETRIVTAAARTDRGLALLP